jgi:hypothetical protein
MGKKDSGQERERKIEKEEKVLLPSEAAQDE